jgi:hypothetical protein
MTQGSGETIEGANRQPRELIAAIELDSAVAEKKKIECTCCLCEGTRSHGTTGVVVVARFLAMAQRVS